MKFEDVLKKLVNDALRQGVKPTEIVSSLELTKIELAYRMVEALNSKTTVLPVRGIIDGGRSCG